jgi:hypothetical protein
LAAVGVVLSMTFVGLELRNNTVAVRAAARNELATGGRELLLAIAASPELVETLRLWRDPNADLTPGQEDTAGYVVRALLRNLENVFLQVDAGIVDDSALASYGVQSPILRSPRFEAMWLRERDSFDPGFAQRLESELRFGSGR